MLLQEPLDDHISVKKVGQETAQTNVFEPIIQLKVLK